LRWRWPGRHALVHRPGREWGDWVDHYGLDDAQRRWNDGGRGERRRRLDEWRLDEWRLDEWRLDEWRLDGIVHEGVEECDDGNDVDTDACTNACTNAVCGDGIVHEGVEADRGTWCVAPVTERAYSRGVSPASSRNSRLRWGWSL
jgi:cysteine-rich repeat protein